MLFTRFSATRVLVMRSPGQSTRAGGKSDAGRRPSTKARVTYRPSGSFLRRLRMCRPGPWAFEPNSNEMVMRGVSRLKDRSRDLRRSFLKTATDITPFVFRI